VARAAPGAVAGGNGADVIRSFLLLLAVALPGPLKRAYYRRVFGWRIGRGVRVGLSFVDARTVDLDEGCRIGHFNVFRGLAELRVGRGSHVANFNQAFGTLGLPGFPSRLLVGQWVSLMSRHFLDVAGVVTIGDGVTFGGRDTQVWSHSLAFDDQGRRSLRPLDVTVGDAAYLGARVTLVGCSVPAGAVVGAGSVLTRSFPPDPTGRRLLIAGNPAAVRKTYPPAPAAEPARSDPA
jgi:acetyltransferase-like isoleucine patch superfamily enzyme